MRKIGRAIGKSAVAALAAVLLLQASAAAAPEDDLNAILENQEETSGSSLLSETLGWEELIAARKEQGGKFSLSLEASEMLGMMMDLPETLSGTMGIQLELANDIEARQWQLDGAWTQDGKAIGNLTLYGDSDMLSLEIPQLLSYPVGLHSGSFLDQYEGSAWEEMFGELELSEDIILNFVSEDNSSAGSLNLLQEWKSIMEEGGASVQDAMEVTVREDSDQPDVTLYDVTYDTESVLDIYGKLLTSIMETIQEIPGAETSDLEEFEEEWQDVIDESMEVLGEEFTVTFSVENEMVAGLSMTIPITEEALGTDTVDDSEDADDPVGTVDVSLAYTDPTQPREGGELVILVSEEEAEETLEIRLSLARVITETTEESTLHLTAKEDEETLYDCDLYSGSFDAKTGEWVCQFQYEQEEEIIGVQLDGTFSNITAGKSFDFSLENLSMLYGSMQISLASGSLSMTAESGAVETPENVELLADMDETELSSMVLEISLNAENWMSEMGLLETEESDTDSDASISENSVIGS